MLYFKKVMNFFYKNNNRFLNFSKLNVKSTMKLLQYFVKKINNYFVFNVYMIQKNINFIKFCQ